MPICRITVTISSCHLSYKAKICTINITNNLEVCNLVLFSRANLIWQSSSLLQLEFNLPRYQIIVSCISHQATQQHKCDKQNLPFENTLFHTLYCFYYS